MLSPDGSNLATYGIQSTPSEPNYRESVLRLTDVNTGHEVATFPNIGAEVFSPDGKIAACSGGNTIRLLNMETGETHSIITSDHDEDSDEHKPLIASLVFSPDGKKIVSGTMGGHLQIWRVETGERLSAFFEETPPKGNTYQEAIRSLAYSSDGSILCCRQYQTPPFNQQYQTDSSERNRILPQRILRYIYLLARCLNTHSWNRLVVKLNYGMSLQVIN